MSNTPFLSNLSINPKFLLFFFNFHPTRQPKTLYIANLFLILVALFLMFARDVLSLLRQGLLSALLCVSFMLLWNVPLEGTRFVCWLPFSSSLKHFCRLGFAPNSSTFAFDDIVRTEKSYLLVVPRRGLFLSFVAANVSCHSCVVCCVPIVGPIYCLHLCFCASIAIDQTKTCLTRLWYFECFSYFMVLCGMWVPRIVRQYL